MNQAKQERLGPQDRMPPYNADAEDSLLGACLHDPTTIDEVGDIVRPDDFFQASRGEIFGVMQEMATEGKTVNAVTLADRLIMLGRFAILGGDDMLRKLCDSVPYALNAVEHAHIIREKSITRGLIEAASETLRECYSLQHHSADLVCLAEERIFAVAEREAGNSVVDMSVSVDEAMGHMELRRERRGFGLMTGFADLDEYTDGLLGGQVIILAARPSQGKTALALDICRMNALKGERSLFFSLEMSRQALTSRLVSSVSGVPSKLIRCPWQMTPQDHIRVMNSANLVHGWPIRIDDSGVRNITQMGAIARREKRRYGLSLIVIDYLSLIDTRDRGGNRSTNREQEVASISRGLKAMSKEIGVPILALQQLNRQVESRGDHCPKLWDLRESGQVEQDADIVLLLHRPEHYDKTVRPGEADVDIAKNRDGDTGRVTLAFRKECTSFSNLARRISEPKNGNPPF